VRQATLAAAKGAGAATINWGVFINAVLRCNIHISQETHAELPWC
jgi:hypothetical protein